ncbi:MAG: extracytoplasmic sigma factor ECF [Phycisphaerae bacterium]|nr:MAG: extracytoplasmic sigma factor ECF [Phycisphaerae bacterium]
MAFRAIYDELRRIAAARLATLPAGQTLEATAIVNEVLARGLVDTKQWESRAHFFGAAAIAVRNLLVEHARRRQAARRAQTEHARIMPTHANGMTESDDELLALDAALERLRQMDERKHFVVSLRFFTGLSIEETAQALGLSTATVERDWAFARAWLQREVSRSIGDPG